MASNRSMASSSPTMPALTRSARSTLDGSPTATRAATCFTSGGVVQHELVAKRPTAGGPVGGPDLGDIGDVRAVTCPDTCGATIRPSDGCARTRTAAARG